MGKRVPISRVDDDFQHFCLLNCIYGLVAEQDGPEAWEEVMRDVFKISRDFSATRLDMKSGTIFVISKDPMTTFQKRYVYGYFRKIGV